MGDKIVLASAPFVSIPLSKSLECWSLRQADPMKEELSKKLTQTYPLLFRQHSFNNYYYFECDDGWFDLLFELGSKIEPLLEIEVAKELCSGCLEPRNIHTPSYEECDRFYGIHYSYATQVKEKFGTLSFYTNHTTDEIYDFIREAEQKSASICEVCGAVGRVVNRKSWLKACCEKHA